MGKKKHVRRPFKKSGSWFGEYAHRWPPAALPLGYAMACVEVVAESSREAGTIYKDIVDAWGKPDVSQIYDEIITEIPDSVKEEWKQMVIHPESILLPDVNKPWTDFLNFMNEPNNEDEIFEGTESLGNLFGLIFAFILIGFNRKTDRDKGIFRVNPIINTSWLLFAVMCRTAFECFETKLSGIQKMYKVRSFKGKIYDFEEVLTKQPMSRMHRMMVAAGKNAKMVLHHDEKFLIVARWWYQCRVAYSSINKFCDAEYEKGIILDPKNVDKQIRPCDEAVGYKRRSLRKHSS